VDYRNNMRQCMKYIDEHIDEDITPQFLAERFQYSFYHFCHVFRICNNMPVGKYLRKRRLERALYGFQEGKSITEIALAIGYDTVSGFSKAFRREFGMSAREYRRKNHLRHLDLYSGKGGLAMQVQIRHVDAMKAVGYNIPPKDGCEADPGRLGANWQGKAMDFSSVSLEDYVRLSRGIAPEIAMWWHPQEESGAFSYFFGPVVENFDFIPDGMVTAELAAGDYAVFTTEPVDLVHNREKYAREIKRLWKAIFEEWFAQSGYPYDQERPCFEYYCESNGGMKSSGAVMNIFIPIKKDPDMKQE
jgi:AraC family transcriptional regulator